jgi:hypothetical protein
MENVYKFHAKMVFFYNKKPNNVSNVVKIAKIVTM